MNKKSRKVRLDQRVVSLGLADTQAKAQAFIMAGEILVNGERGKKAGELISEEAHVALASSGPQYVSRGGIKLAGALDHFRIDPKGLICLDVGASTGGFSDCLLQRGAAHIYTVDVGRGQLDPKIRNHPNVTPRESFHVNLLTADLLDQKINLVVMDVSFTSLQKTLPFVVESVPFGCRFLILIKPQFEADPNEVEEGGVVRDEQVRQRILQEQVAFAKNALHLKEIQLQDSVLKGPSGNQETFMFALK